MRGPVTAQARHCGGPVAEKPQSLFRLFAEALGRTWFFL